MAKPTSAPSRPQEAPKELQRNAPVFTCRHRALKAAVWKNDGESGSFYNVTLTRSYKDGETWRESGSFGYDDVLIVAELLRTCHGFISREMAKQSEEARE
jgi:hypothetical protein